jgi:hypothetical protein
MSFKVTLGIAFGAAALAPAALAQNATGTGCPGFQGFTPTLELRDQVQVGKVAIADVTGAPNTTSLLIGSFNNSTYQGIPLPLDLGLFFPELPGCTLYQNPVVQIPFVHDANGDATVGLGGWIAGPTAYFQVYNLDFDLMGLTQFGGFSPGYDSVSLPQGGTANAGDLVITEIMYDPGFPDVDDVNGEWFEVLNTTGSAIDIEYWTIRDQDFDSHVIDNGGAGVIVPAGGYAVLGNSGDTALNGGYTPDYVFNGVFGTPWAFLLSNSGDEVELVDGAGTVIDSVAYTGGAPWPDGNGESIQLDPASNDATLNDDPANWCLAVSAFGAANQLGTPGSLNDGCVVVPPVTESGELIITEVIQNPSAVADGSGEWFEIFNTTGSSINIDGYVIRDNDSDSHTINNGGPLNVPAGGYLVLGNNGDVATNGGVNVDYVYGTSFFLSNGADELAIEDGAGNLIDIILWDGGPVWPDPNGASMNLDPGFFSAAGNNDGLAWCEGSVAFGDGDLGTPGAANTTCP